MPLLQETSPSPELSPLAIGEDISPLPTIKPAGTTEVDFSGLLASPLRLHEDLANGCGGQLWPAGMTLAKHMLRYHRDDLHKSRVWVNASPFPLLMLLDHTCEHDVLSLYITSMRRGGRAAATFLLALISSFSLSI